jgi:transposase, IS30 family
LRAVVKQKPELDWSPQQIATWLRVEHPDKTEWHVCHETIYQTLYFGGKGGLSRTLTKRLRTGRLHSAELGHARGVMPNGDPVTP